MIQINFLSLVWSLVNMESATFEVVFKDIDEHLEQL